MVARTAKYPELNQHVFVGTRCLTDGEEVKEGNINIVMTFTTPMVKAMPCRVSVNKKVSGHKATQDVSHFVRGNAAFLLEAGRAKGWLST